MDYTIKKLSQLAGVTTRTLRYYDECGLLPPGYISENGYRMYTSGEVKRLQKILFYRALGMGLGEIREILDSPNDIQLASLKRHLMALREKKDALEQLIDNVAKTIDEEEGIGMMTDQERFEAFKKEKIQQNETTYGKELKEKYSGDTLEKSNRRFLELSKEQYQDMETLGIKLQKELEEAVLLGKNPQGETGKQLLIMHRRWLSFTWPSYSPHAHLGLIRMYQEDPRFLEYYDKNRPGCAAFLMEAAEKWLK